MLQLIAVFAAFTLLATAVSAADYWEFSYDNMGRDWDTAAVAPDGFTGLN